MKAKKNLVIILCVIFVGMFLMSAAGAQERNFKLGHLAPVGDPRHEALQKFADMIKEKTNGRLQITIYPGSTLGSERELFEQAQAGVTEFALIGSVVGNFVPQFASMDLPYLWKSQEHLKNAIKGPVGQEWEKQMREQYNVGILDFFDRNPRILVNTKRPVNSIEDLKGMKVRVPEIQMHMDTWRAFGVQPTPMPASEFYMGLKLGVIDAMENPVEVMYHWKIYEVAKYLALTEHVRSALYLIYSTTVMNALSAEDQQIIKTAAEEAANYHNTLIQEQAKTLFDELEKQGMMINEVDKSGFIKAAQEIHKQYMKVIGEETYHKIAEME